MRFDVLTLFPGVFDGYLRESLLEKAIARELVEVVTHDMRRWAEGKHHKVDDRPFGGGPGMVLQVGPIVRCVEEVRAAAEPAGRLIALTPKGRTFHQRIAEEWAEHEERLLLICGRYEGFDQRVFDILQPDEISLGDFILNGGEVAAMAVIDAVLRLVPGVLGHADSANDDSFSTGNRGLEFPQYTRPRNFRGHEVPEILLSGDHPAIARWRAEQSRRRTQERRADLADDSPQPPGNL